MCRHRGETRIMEKRNSQFVEEEHASELSGDHDEGGREIAGNKKMDHEFHFQLLTKTRS